MFEADILDLDISENGIAPAGPKICWRVSSVGGAGGTVISADGRLGTIADLRRSVAKDKTNKKNRSAPMLHIHNGDSSVGTLKMSDVAGEHLPFREILMAGPTPQGLTTAEWRSVRAGFLAVDDGPDEEKCLKDLADQDEALSRFREHEEVVLWCFLSACLGGRNDDQNRKPNPNMDWVTPLSGMI
ncbi:MAG: DUF1835 domain-containing protein [Acidobacteria bacterium]|nr:DUF1835 domain-containing protein [Acidobacteriota bacterium]